MERKNFSGLPRGIMGCGNRLMAHGKILMPSPRGIMLRRLLHKETRSSAVGHCSAWLWVAAVPRGRLTSPPRM